MLFKVYCIINGVIIVAIQVRAHLFEYQREISRGDANSDENLTQIATRHISDDSSKRHQAAQSVGGTWVGMRRCSRHLH